QRGQHVRCGSPGTELGPLEQRLAGAAREHPGPGPVDPSGEQRRAEPASLGGPRSGHPCRAASGRQEGRAAHERVAAGDPGHDAPSPATTVSRVAWRATQATATAAQATRPARTAAIEGALAASE